MNIRPEGALELIPYIFSGNKYNMISQICEYTCLTLFHSWRPFRAQFSALYTLGLKPQALRLGPSRTLSPLNYILYSKSLKHLYHNSFQQKGLKWKFLYN